MTKAIDYHRMQLKLALAAIVVCSLSAPTSAMDLTEANWDSATAGKSVFIKVTIQPAPPVRPNAEIFGFGSSLHLGAATARR